MSKEDLMLALRMVAMGRTNHPLVEQFAGKLEALFAPTRIEPVNSPLMDVATPGDASEQFADAQPIGGMTQIIVTPKRRKKAD